MTKKILLFLFASTLLSSCNRAIMKYCSDKHAPEYEMCKDECQFALPDPSKGQSKADAISECEKICKTKYREDKLNCRFDVDTKCIRKCTKRMARECKTQRRTCIRNGKRVKRNCKQNCTGRWRQRRRCKRNCNRTFRAAKRRCKTVSCKKEEFLEDCIIECL